MAGILNSKERMIDFILTNQGRRQMSDGRMRVEYATFTDTHTFYQASSSIEYNVAEDASGRLFFEATDRHQDIIVPELDAGYSMQPFRAGDFKIEGRKIASGTFSLKASGVKNFENELTGTQITDVATPLLTSLVNNFQELRILQTEDLFSDTSDFKLTAHTASFVITDSELDFGDPNQFAVLKSYGAQVHLNSLPNIFSSKRFSHLPNFKYLPPVNKKAGNDIAEPIGLYPELGSNGSSEELTYEQLQSHLDKKQVLEFGFSDSSRENNFISQIFSLNEPDDESGGIEKLSIIDYGEFSDNDPESPGKHVYFVGKIRVDELGTQTYMNIFTVVID
tara:strand:+ start:377 stop:1384 length:1008 start_codon:yes stop_codon:yes gene_type:complete